MARSQTRGRLLTLEEYDALPEGAPVELVGGMPIVTPAPTPIHQRIVLLLASLLNSFSFSRQLGLTYVDTDVLLPAGSRSGRPTVLRPDVLFVATARLGIVAHHRVVGLPDLVIEVLSPESRATDLPGGMKCVAYERAGVPCYWAIHPDERWGVAYLLREGRLVGGERVVAPGELRCPAPPDFALRLDELFASLDFRL